MPARPEECRDAPLHGRPFSCPAELAGGIVHLLHGERRLALDTGSTRSRWDGGALRWGSRSLLPPTPFPPREREHVSAMVGVPLDGVVGGDVLAAEPFRVDTRAGVVVVGDRALRCDGILVPSALVLGVPVVNLAVEGRILPLLVDTAAVHSYLPPSRLLGRPVVAVSEGYHPAAGLVRREVREGRVAIGGEEVTLSFSLPAAPLRGLIPFGGRVGILGSELFLHFPSIAFDYEGGIVLLSRR